MQKRAISIFILLCVLSINFVLPQKSSAAFGDYTSVHFDTQASGNTNPTDITILDDFFYTVDPSSDEVYKYNPDGTYTGTHFDTAVNGNESPYGITASGGFLWILDDTGFVFKYNPNGTYTEEFFEPSEVLGGMSGIASDDDFFYITSVFNAEVYKYNLDGTYTGTHFDTNADGASDVRGIVEVDGFLFMVDVGVDAVYQFTTNGDFITSFFTDDDNSNPIGITEYDGFLWVTDTSTQEVYKYEGLVPDVTSPIVDSFSPVDDATDVAVDVALDDELFITFDETVVAGTGDVVIYNSSDDSIFETLDVEDGDLVDVDGTDVYLHPTSDFESDMSYYILIDEGTFLDASDNEFAGIDDETTWNFQTYDDVSPVIVSLSPADDEDGADTDTDLVITFDEEVNIDGGEITIYKTEGSLEIETVDFGSEQVSGDGTDTITINLNTTLEFGTDYYVLLDEESFYDENDNYSLGIDDETTWNFTTRSPNSSSSGSTRRIAKTTPPQTPVVLPPNSPAPCTGGAMFSNLTGKSCGINSTPTYPDTNPAQKYIFTKNLWAKMVDPEVKELQKYLNTHGYPLVGAGLPVQAGSPGYETNLFGNLTIAALKKFQLANNLTPDAIFGPITRAKINASVNGN